MRIYVVPRGIHVRNRLRLRALPGRVQLRAHRRHDVIHGPLHVGGPQTAGQRVKEGLEGPGGRVVKRWAMIARGTG